MRRKYVLGIIGWLATVGSLYAETPCGGELGRIAERLTSATSVNQMDEAIDSAVTQRDAFAAGLVRLLQSKAGKEERIRACYLLGQFRVESAINILEANFSLNVGPLKDIDKIPRFGSYPCLDALAYVGKAAEPALIRLLKTTVDRSLRTHILKSITAIEKRDAVEVLRREVGQAEGEERSRLQEALHELGE